jgi:hypothetical protein
VVYLKNKRLYSSKKHTKFSSEFLDKFLEIPKNSVYKKKVKSFQEIKKKRITAKSKKRKEFIQNFRTRLLILSKKKKDSFQDIILFSKKFTAYSLKKSLKQS